MKRVLVIRYGAFGDLVMITPLLRALKNDGYHVTVNIDTVSGVVLNHNPCVDATIWHKRGSVPNTGLDTHWMKLANGHVLREDKTYEKISEPFDAMINLSESIEEGLLKVEGRLGFMASKERRHSLCDVNYTDRTMELGGYGHIRGARSELWFSPEEEIWAAKKLREFQGKFLIVWSLSGSAFHKVYPHADPVAQRFLDDCRGAMTVTVGDDLCRLLEWKHRRNVEKCAKWTIRQSMIMAKYANLVVGTETGLMWAASCYDMPKIVMLSHSSHENLTKYWVNCTPITPPIEDTPCYPCHQLHYSRKSCPTNGESLAPICAHNIRQDDLYNALKAAYDKWLSQKGASHGILRGNE